MALNKTQLAILKTELDDDSKGLGYTGKTDPEMADLINAVGLSNETVAVGVLNGQDLQEVVVGSDHLAITPEKRDAWLAIISAGDGQVKITRQGIIDQIIGIWDGTTTLDNLAALRVRSASRSEVLLGAGVSVSHTDIAVSLGRF